MSDDAEATTKSPTPPIESTTVDMGYREIIKILPHRYPFLMIDRITHIEKKVRVAGYKNVTANENFFMGHFPGLPVMPGVLQLEAMAQCAAILAWTINDSYDQHEQVAYLMSIDGVKFRRPVVPGDRLDLTAELESERRSIIKARCKAMVNGERASEAVITAAVRDRPKD